MAEAEANPAGPGVQQLAQNPPLPWLLRLYDARPAAPWLAAPAVLAFFLGCFGLLTVFADGDADLTRDGSLREAVIRSLLICFVPALAVASRRRARQSARELRPILQPGHDGWIEDVSPTSRKAAGLAGAFLVPALVFASPALFGIAAPEATAPRVAWDLLCFTTAGWLTGGAVAQDIHIARRLSEIGRESVEIDLLEPGRLAPFTRWSLRAVLLWAVYFSIMSLFFLGPSPNPLNVAGSAPLLVVSATVFLLPIRGLHERLRVEKEEQLTWVRGRIRAERNRLHAGSPEGAALANLVAYQSLIERAHAWPLDASAVVRLLLYTAVGVGSWLGGALVERGLDTLVP